MAALYTGAVLGVSRLISEVYGSENILTQPMFLLFALYLFLICSLIMLLVSYMTPEPNYEKIKDVIYTKNTSQSDSSGLKVDKFLTALLIVCVLLIWYSFK